MAAFFRCISPSGKMPIEPIGSLSTAINSHNFSWMIVCHFGEEHKCILFGIGTGKGIRKVVPDLSIIGVSYEVLYIFPFPVSDGDFHAVVFASIVLALKGKPETQLHQVSGFPLAFQTST
ncbi:MAG: hypothetical protein AAGG75_11325 [Bacteroidota bacterium]